MKCLERAFSLLSPFHHVHICEKLVIEKVASLTV